MSLTYAVTPSLVRLKLVINVTVTTPRFTPHIALNALPKHHYLRFTYTSWPGNLLSSSTMVQGTQRWGKAVSFLRCWNGSDAQLCW